MPLTLPYWEELRGEEPRFLPLITVDVSNGSESETVTALVDSGAEHNVFGLKIANQLSIDLSAAPTVEVVGIGEHRASGWILPVKLRLKRYEWTAPVIFTEAADSQAVLGQIGFFAFFDVAFCYQRREMEFRRLRSSGSE